MPGRTDPAPDRESTSSPVVTRMGRGGVLNLVGALTYQASLLAVFTVLARGGQAEVGRYTTCFAVLSLLSLLSLSGLRAAMTRYVAIALADTDLGRLRGTLRLGVGTAAAASVLVAAALALLAPWVAHVMADDALVPGLRVVALTLPAATLTETLLSATQGWRTQRPFTLVGRIGEPLARGVLGVTVLLLGGGFVEALWVGAATAWVAAGVSAWWLHRLHRRAARRLRPSPVRYQVRAMLEFSSVSWVSALAATGLIWAGTLLLGVLTTQEDVGTFAVATRLVTVAVFVMAPINAAFTPHMAHLHHTGDLAQVARVYGSATRWILTLSAPAFVMLVVLPGELLTFFGPSYPVAATVTVVLALGQLVSAAAGPCGTVLTMSGRVWLSMTDNVVVLVLDVVLTLLLVPRFGVVGAAVAWSVSLVLVNVVKLLQVRYVVGLVPVGARWGRVALAALPAVGVALLVRGAAETWVGALLVGGPLVLVAYALGLALVGVPDDDRAVVASVLGRRGRRAAGPAEAPDRGHRGRLP